VLGLTLAPAPVDRAFGHQVAEVVSAVRSVPGLEWFDFGALERLANALMFVPLGVLLELQFRRGWLAFATCVAISLAVEFVQAVALPARTASASDVVANAIGATVGIAVVVVLSRRRAR
jgi:glycopeptide antibiotics resistance protein